MKDRDRQANPNPARVWGDRDAVFDPAVGEFDGAGGGVSGDNGQDKAWGGGGFCPPILRPHSPDFDMVSRWRGVDDLPWDAEFTSPSRIHSAA